jgi:hypothetical protein
MGELTRSAIEGLRLGHGESWGPLWVILDLIEKGSHPDHQSGDEAVDAESVTAEEAILLRKLLVNALERHPALNARAPMIHILGKLADPQYLHLFRSELQSALVTLSEAAGLLYQCLIALDDLGENALNTSEKRSYSITDVAYNVERAREYLRRIGLLIPF